jgi:hypothetical protein
MRLHLTLVTAAVLIAQGFIGLAIHGLLQEDIMARFIYMSGLVVFWILVFLAALFLSALAYPAS